MYKMKLQVIIKASPEYQSHYRPDVFRDSDTIGVNIKGTRRNLCGGFGKNAVNWA